MAAPRAAHQLLPACGDFLTFSRAPWYEGYALEDQQLAGLVMWVPAGVGYPLGALFVVFRVLRYSR